MVKIIIRIIITKLSKNSNPSISMKTIRRKKANTLQLGTKWLLAKPIPSCKWNRCYCRNLSEITLPIRWQLSNWKHISEWTSKRPSVFAPKHVNWNVLTIKFTFVSLETTHPHLVYVLSMFKPNPSTTKLKSIKKWKKKLQLLCLQFPAKQ